MAKDAIDGNWGQPQFAVLGALETGVDETIISNYFAPLVARVFATQAALLAATVPGDGYLARVTAIPGATFFRVAGAWVMYGIPRFATTGARDAAITTPVAGMRTRVTTEAFDREYTSVGWVAGRIARKRAAANLASSSSFATLTLDTVSADDPTFTYSAGVLTCALAGEYKITYSVEFTNNTTGIRGAGIDFSVGNDVYTQQVSTTSLQVCLTIVVIRTFAVGNTLTPQAQQNSGGAMALGASLEILRVG